MGAAAAADAIKRSYVDCGRLQQSALVLMQASGLCMLIDVKNPCCSIGAQVLLCANDIDLYD